MIIRWNYYFFCYFVCSFALYYLALWVVPVTIFPSEVLVHHVDS